MEHAPTQIGALYIADTILDVTGTQSGADKKQARLLQLAKSWLDNLIYSRMFPTPTPFAAYALSNDQFRRPVFRERDHLLSFKHRPSHRRKP